MISPNEVHGAVFWPTLYGRCTRAWRLMHAAVETGKSEDGTQLGLDRWMGFSATRAMSMGGAAPSPFAP